MPLYIVAAAVLIVAVLFVMSSNPNKKSDKQPLVEFRWVTDDEDDFYDEDETSGSETDPSEIDKPKVISLDAEREKRNK